MRIAVIGTGYVGLPLGASFAEMGNQVICVDVESKVEKLKNGIIDMYEEGLTKLVTKTTELGTLVFSADIENSIRFADVIFIAVGTPSDKDGSADLTYVLNVATTIGKCINGYKIIVDKSTVPIGTAKKVKETIEEEQKKCGSYQHFDVVSNPEFMREGSALEDMMKPDRVVIGTDSDSVALVLKELYSPFVMNGNPIIVTSVESAEMIKYASNCFLATKIMFMNEMANICEKVGANIDDVRRGMGSDNRIGNKFLYASSKAGGSCFPKDLRALDKIADEVNSSSKILKSVIDINNKRVRQLCENIFSDKELNTITLWGLSFKAETDDVRESASLDFIDYFLEKNMIIKVYDPMANNNIKKIYGGRINYYDNQYDALNDSDCLVIVTEWKQFRNPDFEMIKNKMKNNMIFDARNLYNKQKMISSGFDYFSIGR